MMSIDTGIDLPSLHKGSTHSLFDPRVNQRIRIARDFVRRVEEFQPDRAGPGGERTCIFPDPLRLIILVALRPKVKHVERAGVVLVSAALPVAGNTAADGDHPAD